MATILTAIRAIKADAQFRYESEDISTLVWSDGNPTNITNEQIEAKQAELTAAEEAAVEQKATDKASAKAKLIAGEALTEAEADTIVI